MAQEKNILFDVAVSEIGKDVSISTDWGFSEFEIFCDNVGYVELDLTTTDSEVIKIEWADGDNFEDGSSFNHTYSPVFSNSFYLLSKTNFSTVQDFVIVNGLVNFDLVSITNWPLRSIEFNSGAIYGDVSTLNSGLTSFICKGKNVVNGDLSGLPRSLKIIDIQGLNEINSYTSGHAWDNDLEQLIVLPNDSFGMLSGDIDDLLIDLDIIDWAGVKILDISGNNHARTSASDTAVASLIIKGVTINVNVPIYGLRFDGASTDLNLGIVPLLNSSDSYIKLRFKAYNFGDGSPNYAFGYDDALTNNLFQMGKFPTTEAWNIQYEITNIESNYPNPNEFNELIISVDNWALLKLKATLNGVEIFNDIDFIPISQSGIDFNIGSRNLMGVSDGFAEIDFAYGEFYNGTTTKIVNAANTWGGGTNNGGVDIVSYDNGNTFTLV